MTEKPGASDPLAPDPIARGPVLSDRRKRLRGRFYGSVRIGGPEGGVAGYRVLLDGRPMRTPVGQVFVLPGAALAEAVAAEWAAQREVIDPDVMPLTRLACTALDRVRGRENEVSAEIARFASTDLLCYRADWPRELAEAQARAWDPVLAWVEAVFAAPFACGAGVAPIAQPEASIASVQKDFAACDALALTALHDMTTLLGSALLALALRHGRLSLDEAWTAAHVDEDWQAARWGRDSEAERRRARRYAEMAAAFRFYELSRAG